MWTTSDDGTIKRLYNNTSPTWLYEVTTRGTDEELKELARSYIKGSPQYAPYMQTVNYAKDGDLNNLKSDYYDESGNVIDVFDSRHPLYHTATALFKSLKHESYKIDIDQYRLIDRQRTNNSPNNPPTPSGGNRTKSQGNPDKENPEPNEEFTIDENGNFVRK